MSHVIAAVSTGMAVSAIGILRLTGDGCAEVADKVFTAGNGKSLRDAPDKKLILGTLDSMYRSQSIEDFMRNSYAYCLEHEAEIREHIKRSEG